MPTQWRPLTNLARAASLVILGAALLVGCTPTTSPETSLTVSAPSSLAPTVMPPAPTVPPTLISSGPSEGTEFFAGVVDVRPAGWFFQTNFYGLVGFPITSGQVYGPEGVAVPPYEGRGRLVLYETSPASAAYLESRIEQSRKRGGRPVAVNVNGEPVEAWLDESTGELVLGWTVRGKSEVLVANTADFTVEELVVSAESVSDCCG